MNRVLAVTASPLQRRLALSCLVGMLLVCAASAWLRLAMPRPPCGDWPECRAQPTASLAPDPAAPAAGIAVARAVHRAAATAVLVMAVILVVSIRRGAGIALRRPAWLLLALALLLAAIGVATPGSRSWVVWLVNPLGGLAMLALASLLWHRSGRRADAAAASPSLLALALIGLWLMQAALGVASGSGLAVAAPLHLALALALVCVASAAAAQASRCGRRTEGRALLAQVTLQVLLGGAAVAGSAAPLRVWAHGIAAAVGLAIVARLIDADAPDSTEQI